MKAIYGKYFIRLTIFSIILVVLSILFQTLLPLYATPAMPYIILFYFIMIAFVHYIVLRGSIISNKNFINNYILGTIIKFLSILIFLGIYIFLNKTDAIRFALTFCVFYFLYAIFEVIALKKDNQTILKK